MAQDAIGTILQDTSTVNFTYNDASNIITADIIIGAIDHDLLLNFVSNEHIDHSTVSIVAGTGLSGGGNLTTSRTLNISNTGVVAASYGDASTISTFTVNDQGQLTDASSVPVLIGANQVSNFSEAVDDRVAALLVAGTNITLTYNDAANTLTIAAPSSGGGSVGGTGSPYQVAHWSSSSNIAGDANFLWDGTSLAVNQNSIPLNSILSTTGTTTSFLFSGYTHHDSTGTPVFRVADDGSIHMGAGLDPLVASDAGLSKESGYTLQSSTGNIHLFPQTAGSFVYVQGALAVNTAAIGSDKFRVEGQTRINLGSDAPGDLLVRGPSGNLVRLPVGSSSEVLGVVSGTPAWVTVSGSLPGGSAGTFAIHDGTGWAAASRTTENQTGITGTAVTLAVTPLNYAPFDLYKNGVYQIITEDYTRSGSSLTMVNALTSTDRITAIYYI
jgi:hypothetical protein